MHDGVIAIIAYGQCSQNSQNEPQIPLALKPYRRTIIWEVATDLGPTDVFAGLPRAPPEGLLKAKNCPARPPALPDHNNSIPQQFGERRRALSEMRPIPRRGLSRTEAAMYLGISSSKFDELRKRGQVSPPRLIDGRKIWDLLDLNRDFEAFPVEGGAEEDWDVAL